MAMIATDLKGLLTINIKSRYDGLADQYNRIFMIKVLLVICTIMGISWYADSIHCIVPESHNIEEGFVHATCWIQGVYVYKGLKNRMDDVAYFGIPIDMDNDGMLPNGDLCRTKPKLGLKPQKDCKEMQKTFFVQYQYFPFLIGAFILLYYTPYLFYRYANNDFILFKKSVKSETPDADKIAKYHFGSKKQRSGANWLRIIYNLLVKILYIGSNFFVLIAVDYILNGDFLYYGIEWIKWSRLNNTVAYDYMGLRDHPKPGNNLLPPFGYCELYESARDVKVTLANKHKFVCELSQHILYQYCFVVLWFAVIVGIVISFFGLLVIIVHYVFGVCIRARLQTRKRLYGVNLSLRELEYLDYVKSKNTMLYGDLLGKLREVKQS